VSFFSLSWCLCDLYVSPDFVWFVVNFFDLALKPGDAFPVKAPDHLAREADRVFKIRIRRNAVVRVDVPGGNTDDNYRNRFAA